MTLVNQFLHTHFRLDLELVASDAEMDDPEELDCSEISFMFIRIITIPSYLGVRKNIIACLILDVLEISRMHGFVSPQAMYNVKSG